MFTRKGLSWRSGALVLMTLGSVTAKAGSLTLLTSQSQVGTDDYFNWSQQGPDGTPIPDATLATSVNGNLAAILFGGGTFSGLTSVVCPATPSCSWSNSTFPAGDTLIFTSDGTNANGPLFLFLGNPVFAAGLALQANASGSFTAEIQVQFTGGGLSSVYTLNSDSSGDPVFIGLGDSSQEIQGVFFDVTNSGSNEEFAADTLYTSAPEPASILLFGSALVGIGLTALLRGRSLSPLG